MGSRLVTDWAAAHGHNRFASIASSGESSSYYLRELGQAEEGQAQGAHVQQPAPAGQGAVEHGQ